MVKADDDTCVGHSVVLRNTSETKQTSCLVHWTVVSRNKWTVSDSSSSSLLSRQPSWHHGYVLWALTVAHCQHTGLILQLHYLSWHHFMISYSRGHIVSVLCWCQCTWMQVLRWQVHYCVAQSPFTWRLVTCHNSICLVMSFLIREIIRDVYMFYNVSLANF